MVNHASQSIATPSIPDTWKRKTTIEKADLSELFLQLNNNNAASDNQSQALSCLNHWVMQSQNEALLTHTAQSLQDLLQSLESEKQQDFLKQCHSAMLIKLAWKNDILRSQVITFFLHDLDLDNAEWLYVVLQSNQYLAKIGKPGHILVPPDTNHPQFDQVTALLTLAQSNQQAKTQVLSQLENILTVSNESNNHALTEAKDLVSLVTKTQARSELYPFAQSHIRWQKGYNNTLLQKIASLPDNTVSWMLVALSTGQARYGDYTPEKEDYAFLQQVVKQFGRAYVTESLNDYLSQKGLNHPLSFIKQYYKDQVASLDQNSQKWLLLDLVFKNFPHIPETGTTKPEGDNYTKSCKLRDTVYGCPQLWSMLQEQLLEKIGADANKIAPFIPGLIFMLANQIPDEARLWLYLSITTNTNTMVFDIAKQYHHEQLGDTAISQMLIEDITDHFLFLAKTNDMMRSVVKSCLSQKQSPDEDFSRKVKAFPLYEKSFVENQLNKIDQNAQQWLFYAICFQLQPTKSIQLSQEVTIKVPTGRQFDQVSTMLNQMHDSPEIRVQYLTKLYTAMTDHTKKAFDQLINKYLSAVANNLSKEEQTWLYLTLQNFEPTNHQVRFQLTYQMPTENLTKVAKVLFLTSQFHEQYEFLKTYLKEKNGTIEFVAPSLLDKLGPVTNQLLKPGQMASLAAMDEKQASQLAFQLCQPLPEPMKAWLAAGFQKGIIDSTPLLLLSMQSKIPPAMLTPLLSQLTSVLLLALKWPSLQDALVKTYGSPSDPCQFPTTIRLDGLPVGDTGCALLADALCSQADQIETLSLMQTQITDESLITLAQSLLPKTRIKLLNLNANGMKSENFANMIEHPNVVNNTPALLATLSAILSQLADPDLQGYLAARYITGNQAGMNDSLPRTGAFFVSDANQADRALADLLLAKGQEDLSVQSFLGEFVKHISPVHVDSQLSYFALTHSEPKAIERAFTGIIQHCQNEQLKQWMAQCLKEGHIQPPTLESEAFKTLFGNEPNQTDIIQMLQAASLMLACDQDQRHHIYKQLSNEEALCPPISKIAISKYHMPSMLQALIALGIQKNNDQLASISLSSMALESHSIDLLCHDFSAKQSCDMLDLSDNPLNADTLTKLSQSLKTSAIQTLNLSRIAFETNTLAAFLDNISQSNIQTLIMVNHSDIKEDKPKQLTNLHAKAIASFLEKPGCPIRHLELGHNNISALGLNYLLKAIKNNPSSALKSINLDHQTTSNERCDKLKDEINQLLAQRKQQNDSAQNAGDKPSTNEQNNNIEQLAASFDKALLFQRQAIKMPSRGAESQLTKELLNAPVENQSKVLSKL